MQINPSHQNLRSSFHQSSSAQGPRCALFDARRHARNSLSETVVFGKILGEHLAEALDDLPSAPSTCAMLVAAEAVVRGALAREESRGAHHREDFPEKSGAWRKNMLCAADEGGEVHLWTEPVVELPEGIQKALDEDYSLDYHYLE